MNTVCITGRLTATPALSTTKTGKSVTTFQVAVRQDREHTDFFRVVAWQTTAEHVCRWFSKGQMVAIEGRLSVNRYTDKDGRTREQVEIVAEEVGFCDSVRAGAEGTAQGSAGAVGTAPSVSPAGCQLPQRESQEAAAREIEEIVDGDLPF